MSVYHGDLCMCKRCAGPPPRGCAGCDRLRAALETTIKQNHETVGLLKEENEKLKAELSKHYDAPLCERLADERDQFKAEVERLRAVAEAAREFENSLQYDWLGGEARAKLILALAALYPNSNDAPQGTKTEPDGAS